jgi:hypothetical protein
MAAKLIGTTPEGFAIYFGSEADRTAITAPKEGTKFFQDDGSVFIGLGTSGWKPDRIAGAALVTDPMWNYVTYAGGGYTYYCQSVGGSDLTDSVWQVARKTDATGTITYAGTVLTFGSFTFRADNLATVAALTYNNGVAI